MKATVLKQRKDGKFKVSFSFSGGPNGFGGLDHGRVINKIMTSDAIRADIERNPEAYTLSTIARFKG